MIEDDVEKMLWKLVTAAFNEDELVPKNVDETLVAAAEVLIVAVRTKRAAMAGASTGPRKEATDFLAALRVMLGAIATCEEVPAPLRIRCAKLVLV